MAEIVGTVASVAQLVQLSGALLAGGYNFLSKVARAPSEIRSLLTETAAVNSLLAQIQQIADTSPKAAADDALQALERVGVFEECQSTLKSIERALAKCEQVNGQDAKNFGRKLMWPFKEKETKDALQRLHHMRGLLANAIEANSASAIRRIELGQGLILNEMKDMSEQLRAQMSREETQKLKASQQYTTPERARAAVSEPFLRADSMLALKGDIQTLHYIKEELQLRLANGILKLRNKSILPIIERHISLCAGTILQARLQIDYICAAKSDKEIKHMIQRLPNGLGYTYQILLHNIAARYPTKIQEVQKLFRCLVAAASPMTARQLAEVLAIEPEEHDLDHDAVATDPYDVLEPVSALVRIEDLNGLISVVKLCHYSFQEYLSSDEIRQSPANEFYVDKDEAHAWMTGLCLRYLTFDAFRKPLDESLDPDVGETYVFRVYAAFNWYRHATLVEDYWSAKDIPIPFVYLFFDSEEGPPCYTRWQELLATTYTDTDFFDYSPICLCIWLGLNATATDLI
ncbi:hypothetical protein J4E83_007633 [Alternaria metachromatica]|uniref:uncharacterized protein n=1 Tax=Alternaria metachromatica TaxID=283354 RepID=UPI0020C30185|nr:uncharacterized protein J4E83_007633 [Alternaria metachromatica]KAI4613221.1 hypothetical protein J4E83_007633 [Alternaria metachromatica]